MDSVSVITVTYNSSHILESYFDYLQEGRGPGDEILIVDSGSADAARSKLITEARGGRFIGIADNIGYGQGSNIGVSQAAGEWVAIVNPDVLVRFSALHELSSVARRQDLACIGPSISLPDGTAVPNARGGMRPPWRRTVTLSQPVGIADVTLAESISGCCMVLPIRVFQDVGGFDAHFFMFAEEVDLQLRIRERGGFVGMIPSVGIVTPGGSSSSVTSSRWSATERHVGHVRFIRKHFTLGEAGLDLLYRTVKVVSSNIYKPRLVSVRQLWAGSLKKGRPSARATSRD